MKKHTKFKQWWCGNMAMGHKGGDELAYSVDWLPYSKKFLVEITNICEKCGAEIYIGEEYLTPSEYVRFNSKHLFDKFVEEYAKERIYDFYLISEGIKKGRRVRKV